MGDLSPHFSRHEFRDSITGEVRVNPELVERLELLRTIAGNRPISIRSGYRSKNTNAAVGGAPKSQHLTGSAADLDYGTATVEQARRAGFRGVGHCRGWAVHVDVRPGATAVFPDC